MKKKLSVLMAAVISVTSLGFGANSLAYETGVRLAGTNRYQTSYKVSARNKGNIAILANGEIFADSLSAINLANKYDASIILTNNRLDIVNVLRSRGIKTVYLVGGYNSISTNLENTLRTEFFVERVAGSNRYETSKATIAKAGYTKLGVASAENYLDALAASPLLKQEDAGLLLVDGKKSYTPPNGSEIRFTFGGPSTVMQNGGERIYGNSRYETALKIANRVVSPTSMAIVSGRQFADALSAANLVITDNAIIVPVQRYPYKEVIDKAKKVSKIFIVGGEASVSRFTEEKILAKDNTNPEITNPDTGLRPDQKEFLDNLEELGDNINDRIDDVEDIVDKLNDMPHLNLKPGNAIDNISNIITKLNNLDKTIQDILNNNTLPEAIKEKLLKYVENILKPYGERLIKAVTKIVVRNISRMSDDTLVRLINDLNRTNLGKMAVMSISVSITDQDDLARWGQAIAASNFGK